MSGYILCQVKKAEKPFYIENISTNIYSIEELCYYLYNNLYLVDRSLISNKLCTWLDEELKLPKLAAKLRPFIGKEAGLEEILYPIFKEINYLAYEELRILNGRIERRNKESEEIREKRKGDALMENRMYVNAIRVYQKLLEKDSREISREMRERILHNQGCAYSYLFQMDKALDCFFAAWKVNQSEKALKIYLLAYRSVHTPEEFEKIQEDLKAEDSVKKETARALEQFISLPEQKIAPGETDRILEDLPGFFFCVDSFFFGKRREIVVQSLSDTGFFQINAHKSIFFGKKTEKNRIIGQNFKMDSRFREDRMLKDLAFFTAHICVKNVLDRFSPFFFWKWCLMIGIWTVQKTGLCKLPDSIQGEIVTGSVVFCKGKLRLF